MSPASPISRLCSHSPNRVGSAATPSMRLYMDAVISRNRMVAVMYPVSTSTFHRSFQLSLRFHTAISIAAREPAAPASTGVTQPV